MKIVDLTTLSKEIHFPISRAVYNEPPKRTWYQKILKFITYRRFDEIMENYILWVPCLKSYVFIPASLIYDKASVPKVLNGFFNTDGMLLLGSLPHDFGYRYKQLILVHPTTGELYLEDFSKSELDEIFGSLCAWESGFPRAAAFATGILSIAGFIGWNENRKKNRNLREDFPGVFAGGEPIKYDSICV